jgi:hypothetical protein
LPPAAAPFAVSRSVGLRGLAKILLPHGSGQDYRSDVK